MKAVGRKKVNQNGSSEWRKCSKNKRQMLIEQIIIIALLVLSIHYTMQPDEIFGKLGDWLEDHLPDKIHPAVFACNVCMAPHYGTVLYWLIPWQHELWQWPVVIVGAMGVNVVINKWTPEKEDKHES